MLNCGTLRFRHAAQAMQANGSARVIELGGLELVSLGPPLNPGKERCSDSGRGCSRFYAPEC